MEMLMIVGGMSQLLIDALLIKLFILLLYSLDPYSFLI